MKSILSVPLVNYNGINGFVYIWIDFSIFIKRVTIYTTLHLLLYKHCINYIYYYKKN
jgi:sRNA-binding regulator protein Hfq